MIYWRLIEQAPGKFVVESNTGWFGRWKPYFYTSHAGPMGHRFRTVTSFLSAEIARQAILDAVEARRKMIEYPRVIQEAYVANNGQWCPVHSNVVK